MLTKLTFEGDFRKHDYCQKRLLSHQRRTILLFANNPPLSLYLSDLQDIKIQNKHHGQYHKHIIN